MIVTRVDQDDHWTCLVRRGMLHSETESIEHWSLAPGQELAPVPGSGVDEAFVVLSGRMAGDGGEAGPGGLLLVPDGSVVSWTAVEPTALLSVRVHPEALSRRLPPRVPQVPPHERHL